MSSATPSDAPKASVLARDAFALYNEAAGRCGLSIARSYTKPRARALALRVKEAGGIDGFKKAIANLEQSDFLKGKNNRGWRADLDFICQPASFMRLFEGGYNNGNGSGSAENLLNKYKHLYDGVS